MSEKKKDLPKIQVRKIKKRVDELGLEEKKNLRAVAIKYDVKKDRAPKIVASGRGGLAEEILRLAEENKVPFYEDKALGELLGKLQFDEEIPPELYTVVAEVLAFVYQLNKITKQRLQKGKSLIIKKRRKRT